MKILEINWKPVSCGLKTPFRTALRSIDVLEVIRVEILADNGLKGTGGCAPTAAITGETAASLCGALEHISNLIRGMECSALGPVIHRIRTSMAGNSSAKAAIDIALHDLYTKSVGIPLYNFLGGAGGPVTTDLTISLNSPDEMVRDALSYQSEGFSEFKLKVGGAPSDDVERIVRVREALGADAVIRVDANQGWSPRDAVNIINRAEKLGAALDFVEQPVAAYDLRGLKHVRDNIGLPVVADETVFSARDALRLVEADAADGINIKLMKCGGISEAVKIAAIAETAGLFCMVGCMMESHAGVTAAAHLASALRNLRCADLDVPLLCSGKTEAGGAEYSGALINLPDRPGLGMES